MHSVTCDSIFTGVGLPLIGKAGTLELLYVVFLESGSVSNRQARFGSILFTTDRWSGCCGI